MRIKSTAWQVLAAASFCVGGLYALGLEGRAQTGGSITDGQFLAALVLILAAVLFIRLGFAAERQEQAAARRKAHREPEHTVKPGKRKAG